MKHSTNFFPCRQIMQVISQILWINKCLCNSNSTLMQEHTTDSGNGVYYNSLISIEVL